MKKMIFLMLLFFLGITANVNAQVSIGGTEPEAGAILDLDGGVKGGLKLSNVDITDLGKIPVDDGELKGITGYTGDVDTNADLAGMVVYNRVNHPGIPQGVYIWNGTEWQITFSSVAAPGVPELTCEPIESVVLSATTSTVILGASGSVNFSVLSDGTDVFSGSLTKKTYQWWVTDATGATDTYELKTTKNYDLPTYTALFGSTGTYKVKVIADNCASQPKESNEITVYVTAAAPATGTFSITGVTCYDIAQSGDLTGRTPAFAFTHDMTYTFNYTGTYSDLSFVILSGEGTVISSVGNLLPGNESGTGSGSCSFHVNFSPVETTLVGGSASATIAAMYVENGNPKMVQFSLTVKDATCCEFLQATDGKCYRKSADVAPRNQKANCAFGWSRSTYEILSSVGDAARWYQLYGSAETWRTLDNTNATYFWASPGGAWVPSIATDGLSKNLSSVCVKD